jgi:hypothetical protein
MKELSQARLREVLYYQDGHFYWKVLTGNARVGRVAGCIVDKGYRLIGINGQGYRAHRLAWLYVYGTFPEGQIDHINHNPDDNRIDNLRDVSNQENHRNKGTQKNNKSGCHGVSRQKNTGKWLARIKVSGRGIHLGTFPSFSDAKTARKAAEVEYGFHPNHGAVMR